MPPSADHIRDLVAEYLDRHPVERSLLSGLPSALDACGAPTSRTTLPGHITCSAVVIDSTGRVLHISHRASGLLLAPGGHVEDGDDTLLGAALREVQEETGIPASLLVLTPEFGHVPIDIDVHDIEGRPSKGEPAHRHFDFRFVMRLTPGAPALALQEEEVAGAVWLAQDEVRSPTLRAKLCAAGLDGTITPVNASAVIHDGQGRYLLHLRDANKPEIWAPGCWDLLGGGREPHDATLRDTVTRELREEAGLVLADLEPYRVDSVIGADGTRVPVELFTGEWHGDPSELALTEGVMLAWFPPEQLTHLTMLPSTRALLETHAADRPAPAPAADRSAKTATAVVGTPAGTELHIIGVHLYLEHDGKVLLGLRHPDSAYAGDTWHALAGHCAYEAATDCLVREAREEAGLVLDPADLDLVHTVHMIDKPGDPPRIGLFFRARYGESEPEVREPDKCVAWEWFGVEDLPERVVPYTRAAIEGIRAGRTYTELGWRR
ncbi:NUDIX domain-containing protein [Streptomyces sp. NPDC085460]|uniref:NUDIX domain-containing protein n=1 Tax=Streptomyces sp. NPDC085460 TaxID=3365723 RepID=UPI0037D95801